MIRLSLLLLFYGSAALAEEPAKVLPLPVIAEGSDATGIAEGASRAKTQEQAKAVNSKDNETAEYQLFDLQPVSVSTYPAGIPSVSRYYLHFRNSDGHHYLIYEEDPSQPQKSEVNALRLAMDRSGGGCSLQVDCRSKAFCTGKCNHMYYQVSNISIAGSDSDRCNLVSFTCMKGREVGSPIIPEDKSLEK